MQIFEYHFEFLYSNVNTTRTTLHLTEKERKEADAARQHRNRTMETDEQRQLRHQQDADAHHQHRTNNNLQLHKFHTKNKNLRLHNFARDFSEDMNAEILHQINVSSDAVCTHCNAFKLPAENSGMCCSNGKVMSAELNVPSLLQSLLTSQDNISKRFHDNIRLYNSAFTFTSVGARFDHELANAKTGVYTFRVQGSFYHRIGSLLPNPDSQPQYLQMYIWDTQRELYH
jgi:hypothetical protein